MSITEILIKRDPTSGTVPTPSQITQGELALNYGVGDGGLYYLDSGGTVSLVRAGTASYALIAQNATGLIPSASYAITSSFSTFAQNSLSASYAVTASFILGSISNAISASYALSASYAKFATSASAALSASWAALSVASLTASLANTASLAVNATSALSASYAQTASFALNGGTGGANSVGGLATYRATAGILTPTLTSASFYTGTLAIGPAYAILQVSASQNCRIRFYTSASYRDRDLLRAIDQFPVGDHGEIADFYPTGSSSLVLNAAPEPLGSSMDQVVTSSIAYSIQNRTSISAPISITITYLAIVEVGTGLDLLIDSSSVFWNVTGKLEDMAQVTLAGNRNLIISGAMAGFRGTLIVVQDATGSRTLSLPSASIVRDSGAGTIGLSTVTGSIDTLAVLFNGVNYLWTYGKSFT